MTRFKRCENPSCDGMVSRVNPIIITFRASDEGFGKMKICKNCHMDLVSGYGKFLRVGGFDREIERYDDIKKITYLKLKDGPEICE